MTPRRSPKESRRGSRRRRHHRSPARSPVPSPARRCKGQKWKGRSTRGSCRGTGKGFRSGSPIGGLIEQEATDHDPEAFERTVDRLEALRVPTIVALNGSVYGGSTDLALACDFRFGAEGIQLRMPAARLGIVYYASGIERYVSRLGIAAAKKLFLTA